MPKKLAQALMEAGMKHFDGGGMFDTFDHTANTLGTAGLGGLGAVGQQLTGNTNSGLMKGPQQAQAAQQGPGLMLTSQDLRSNLGINDMQRQAVYNNQSTLADQLMAQSRGQGPNPALNQLNQTTAQNVNNQGALMASQRGASSNPALIARQAAMQGANIQQQAAGQAATLSAQQQLAAGNAAAGLYGTMGNQVGQQQSTLQGALASQNASAVNQELGFGNMATNASMENARNANGMFGGMMQGAGAALAFLNKGGEVQKMSDGGIAQYDTSKEFIPLQRPGDSKSPDMTGLGSALGKGMGGSSTASGFGSGGGTGGGGTAAAFSAYAEGGRIPFSKELLDGGKVPGKASVKGDSKENDVEPTLLSPGEIVLPRSITMHPDAPRLASEFVKHLRSHKKGSFADVVESRKMCGGGKL